MAAFLISSIFADRPREDPEEFIDSRTLSPTLRRERTLTPIDDEPEAKSGSLFILREWRAVEETKNLGLLREELRKGNSRVQIKKGKTLGSTRAKRV